MTNAFFTIGHSTRAIATFAGLLTDCRVRVVADVRTVPRSRANEQFDRATLPSALAAFGIDYAHLPGLGGLRGRQRKVDPSANAFWQNRSFHNYADYAMSGGFRDALCELRALGRDNRCAIMCAEAVWWRCHRRIVTDYLIEAGENVFHILGKGHVVAAVMTPAARRQRTGVLVYPNPS